MKIAPDGAYEEDFTIMPCYFPLQASFSVREDGKKDVKFSNARARMFYNNILPSQMGFDDDGLSIPCGRCIGCRLERSRQWATRIMHEASMHDDNCFLTLTYDEDHVPEKGTLVKKHVQDFLKRIRSRFCDKKIRVFYCGEYGEQLLRPHYHLCLFNVDFVDKKLWKESRGFRYFTSDVVSILWPYGHHLISDLSYDSAAYVARYCTKKITGSLADEHYGDRLPEFAHMSLKPAIGKDWFTKFGKSDVVPFDEVIVRGVRTKPPRYYDKLLEKENPSFFEKLKDVRKLRCLKKESDNCRSRLMVKLKCHGARLRNLVRELEIRN